MQAETDIRAITSWFKENLPIPTKFSKKKNSGHKNTNGLSWFKPEENLAVKKMWELKSILEDHGYYIDVVKVKNPGKIVYEDKLQVVAEPYGSEI